jgi:outer membrane immunogenic protein
MRRTTIAVLGLSLGLYGVASAADMAAPVYKAPQPVAPPFSWTGFYLGANIGGAWARGTISDTLGDSFSVDNSGVIGGGQIGYNWQVSNWVLGFEWMFDGTSLSRTSGPVTVGTQTLQASTNTRWLTTVTGRLGWAIDHYLIYAKGGGAWANTNGTLTDLTDGVSVSGSNTRAGWTAGAGWEWAFAPQWSARIEYDYVGLNSWSTSAATLATAPVVLVDGLNVSRNIQMVTVGVNYRFNWGGY